MRAYVHSMIIFTCFLSQFAGCSSSSDPAQQDTSILWEAGVDASVVDMANDAKSLDSAIDASQDSTGKVDMGLDQTPSMEQTPSNEAGSDLTVDQGLLADQGPTADQNLVDQGALSDGTAIGKLVINEVDYDQIDSDVNEFIEVYNTSSMTASLTDLALIFVNGKDNKEYLRVDLSSAGTLAPNGYLVVATNTVTVDPAAKTILFAKANDNIQNGDPDGVALVNTASNTIIDALSYEGAITAAELNGFPSPVTLVEGTALPSATADKNNEEGSLSRLPNGTDTNDASTDWKYTTTPTPGKANQ